MPKLKINDITMYYEVHGQGHPCVLVAGFSVDHSAWDSVVDQLAKQYQVITFDNRGCGQSDVPVEKYSVDIMADDVYGLCLALGIQKAIFIGSSMGGYILQSLAYRYPDLVDALVISNSVMKSNRYFQLYLEACAELMKYNVPSESMIKMGLSWVYSNSFLEENENKLIKVKLENPYPFSLQGFNSQLSAVKQFDSRSWAHNIKQPTLVIGSDEDVIFREVQVRELSTHLPNTQYYGFKAAGHLPFIEHPQEFIDVVNDFIAKINV